MRRIVSLVRMLLIIVIMILVDGCFFLIIVLLELFELFDFGGNDVGFGRGDLYLLVGVVVLEGLVEFVLFVEFVIVWKNFLFEVCDGDVFDLLRDFSLL